MALNDDATLRQMAGLMEVAGVLIAVFDQDDRLRFANRAFRDAWCLDETDSPLWSEMMRRNFLSARGTVIKATDFETWLRSTLSRRGKTGFRAYETDLHDGRWLWMTETMQPNGWMLCVASDITSMRPDERTLRQDRDDAIRVSQIDELTGIPSRRFAMAKIDDLLRSQGGAPSQPAGCLAVLDIDNFKYINDRFGHSVGDAVLKDFAKTLHSHVRKTDVLGRVGGEEFVLILPNASPENALTIVGKMLEAVRHSRPVAEQQSFRYTFSAGIASGDSGDSAADLYRRADLALYAAKMRGRNQVCLDPETRLGRITAAV
ncbi:sensor domain-containing diguanylate cyclase [Rhizobium soli]|jgi:diguanylate cyclase (GGDEF)-like protein|uniref:diguanylate cyclase n=2 Tax=Rhizobium TaxID=379 RepID=A0A7X0JHE7_9HYPH|nr:diguanylate cyclase (GGDEF)-like protein [Rhizobium soli]